MLFVVGLTLLVGGALIIAAAGLVFQNRLGPRTLQWMIGTQVVGVILATFMGSGLMIVFLFFVGHGEGGFGWTEAGISLALLVVGGIGLRELDRRQKGVRTARADPAAPPL